MAKVHIACVQSIGSGEARVILSNGDELTLLTSVYLSTGVDSISTFQIEGYIGGGSIHEREEQE